MSCRAKAVRISRRPNEARGAIIGAAQDRHEREADRVANQVVRMPNPTSGWAADSVRGTTQAGERALSTAERGYFEPRFGLDFSQVRIHEGAHADASAKSVGADAYTLGANVVLRQGAYQPGSASGKRLMAHELAHVVQQSTIPATRGTIQRTITIQDPALPTPNPSAVVQGRAALANILVPGSGSLVLAAATNAVTAEGWIQRLCPDGQWRVNRSTGVVDSPVRATFCGPRPTRGQAHRTTSRRPTSCQCLCDLSGPGSTNVSLHVANSFTVGGTTLNVNAAGEGVQLPPGPGRPEHNVGISGRDATTISGAGDTFPLGGTRGAQTIRDPPWIIFGHEVCGHARLHTGFAPFGHATSPEGNRSAVDFENEIRREHSTLADNFGVRRGTFPDATGTQHVGAEYRVSPGETLSGIARRVGIAQADRRTHIFRAGGVAITAANEGRLAINERLLIDGIEWHRVIRGETMTSIARMWNVSLSSLRRANPGITNPHLIRIGQRLLIPRS